MVQVIDIQMSSDLCHSEVSFKVEINIKISITDYLEAWVPGTANDARLAVSSALFFHLLLARRFIYDKKKYD